MSRMVDPPWRFGRYGRYSDRDLQQLIDDAEGNAADSRASAREYERHAKGLQEVLDWNKQERKKK